MDRKEVADVLPLLTKGSIIEHTDGQNNVRKRDVIEFLIDPGGQDINQFALVVSILPEKTSGAVLDISALAAKIRAGTVRVVPALQVVRTAAK